MIFMKKKCIWAHLYMAFIGLLFFNFGFDFDWNLYVDECFDLISAKVSVGLYYFTFGFKQILSEDLIISDDVCALDWFLYFCFLAVIFYSIWLDLSQ